MWRKLYIWIVYPVMMILNTLAFLLLFLVYKKGDFHIRDLVITFMLLHFTLSMTMARFNKGSFRPKTSGDVN